MINKRIPETSSSQIKRKSQIPYMHVCMYISTALIRNHSQRKHPKGVHCSQVSFYHEEGGRAAGRAERGEAESVEDIQRIQVLSSVKYKREITE